NLTQIGSRLKLDHLFRNGRDGLRSIDDRLRQQRQLGGACASDEHVVQVGVVSRAVRHISQGTLPGRTVDTNQEEYQHTGWMTDTQESHSRKMSVREIGRAR